MNYIFDFDGTIADSMPAMIAVYNKIVRNNENPLTPAEIQKLRGMSSRKALKNLGVRWWQYPKLLVVGMGDFHALMPKIKPHKDLPNILEKISSRGDRMFIVTSNTEYNVELFLKTHKLEYFEKIYGSVGLFRKSQILRRVVKENGLIKKHTAYVGDETRDIKAAKSARIKAIAVTWGLNNTDILRKSKPTFMVDFPGDILKIKLS